MRDAQRNQLGSRSQKERMNNKKKRLISIVRIGNKNSAKHKKKVMCNLFGKYNMQKKKLVGHLRTRARLCSLAGPLQLLDAWLINGLHTTRRWVCALCSVHYRISNSFDATALCSWRRFYAVPTSVSAGSWRPLFANTFGFCLFFLSSNHSKWVHYRSIHKHYMRMIGWQTHARAMHFERICIGGHIHILYASRQTNRFLNSVAEND